MTSQSDAPRKTGLEFDGNNYVVTDYRNLGKTTFTVEAICRPSPSPSKLQTIIGNLEGRGFSLNVNNGRWEFQFHDGIKYVGLRSNTRANPDRPTHVVGVYDKGKSEIRLFVDGRLEDSKSVNGHLPANLDFVIAGNPRTEYGDAEHRYSGIIYEVRVSDEALYSTAFEPPSELTSGENTALLLRFDKDSYETIYDASGNGHIGVHHSGN